MPTPIQALSFPLAVDAGLGRLRQEPDPNRYLEQLIRQVILTAPGERIHRPDFGAGLQRQVFALNSSAGAILAETSVYQALERWLGALIRVERRPRSVAIAGRSRTKRDGSLTCVCPYKLRRAA